MAVLSIGLFSLFNMPRGEDPEMEQPSFSIIFIYPGTSPADMEQLVVDKAEKRLNELDDVKKLISDVSDGLAVVRIDYKHESDPDEKVSMVGGH